MSAGIVKLSKDEVRQTLSSRDFEHLEKGEQVFKLSNNHVIEAKSDPLLDVEISLRRGERVGLFTSYGGKKKNRK